MIRALLFDMDGLIVDTEPIHFLAFRAYLRRFGFEMPESLMASFVGYTEADNLRDLKERYGLDKPVEEMVRERRAVYLELIKTEPIVPFRGFWEVTEEAHSRGLKQAVVSSSIREHVEIILRRLFASHPGHHDPGEHFHALVTGDDVARPKPAPDIYLLAAQRLHVSPADCLALEDTPPGVQAAVGAGMTAIAVRNQYSRELEFPGAHAVVDGLRDVLPYLDM